MFGFLGIGRYEVDWNCPECGGKTRVPAAIDTSRWKKCKDCESRMSEEIKSRSLNKIESLYTYSCDDCGYIHTVRNAPGPGLCKSCRGVNHTLLTVDKPIGLHFPSNNSPEDRIIEMVEERYGSGKAMQVADILRGE